MAQKRFNISPMTIDTSAEAVADNSPGSPALQSRCSAYERSSLLTLTEKKERQRAKLRELRDALAEARLLTVEEQAEALALSTSTTWNLLNGNHKGSGLSAKTLNRMLAAPRLPPPVRAKILEYISEKAAGLYGSSLANLKDAARDVSEQTTDG